MIERIANARRLVPLAIFAILILILISSAITTIVELVASRNALAAESELLGKLKERAAKSDGQAALDPADYVFAAPSQGVATADLQRRVSEILVSSGADLQLSEIIPADAEGDVGRLAIAINFEIEEAKLAELLYALENARPALLIERLSVRVLGAGQGVTHPRLQGTATIVSAWRIAS